VLLRRCNQFSFCCYAVLKSQMGLMLSHGNTCIFVPPTAAVCGDWPQRTQAESLTAVHDVAVV
jgi:hypothetical protein